MEALPEQLRFHRAMKTSKMPNHAAWARKRRAAFQPTICTQATFTDCTSTSRKMIYPLVVFADPQTAKPLSALAAARSQSLRLKV